MALKNPNTGEYLKVVGFQADFRFQIFTITYLIFKDQEQRQRYESGLSPYENFQHGMENFTNEQWLSAQVSNTTKDSILTTAYNVLKNGVFAGWEDC
ncbi:MAG: hypothetical protein D6799_01395 [Bacteroidetes bacterium]|nr:MAG: hypothetical protein D6799_01395 [Bacteroidota bacterium]